MSAHRRPGQGELIDAWTIQRRVIGALLMREVLTRFGRHNIGFLWIFVEPMLFTLGVTALWTAARSVHGSDLPIVAFAVTGYSSVLLWRNMPARCINAVAPNLALMYHRYVKVIDIFSARVLLEAIGATMSFIFLGLFFTFIDWLDAPVDVLKILMGWGLLAWFGIALAFFLGAMSEMSELVEKLWHPTSYLFFPLSGAAYVVDALPKSAQNLALFLPTVNGIEIVREGYFGGAFVAHYDLPYLLVFNILLTFAALLAIRIVSRRVMPE